MSIAQEEKGTEKREENVKQRKIYLYNYRWYLYERKKKHEQIVNWVNAAIKEDIKDDKRTFFALFDLEGNEPKEGRAKSN